MRMEIPDDVWAAIIAVVAWSQTINPDDDKLLADDIPAIAAWLAELGLTPPPDAATKVWLDELEPEPPAAA
jgi:hypothetical protein